MSHLEKGDNGTLGTGPSPYSRPIRKPLANPGPLGLFGFASTTLILSLYNVQAAGVKAPNVVIGMALFVGGLAQFMAGMWEFAAGNTFGATAFSMYGGFWGSYATVFIPSSGILDAYAAAPDELSSALGIYLITWFVITFLLLIASTRHNIGLVALFFFLMITFILLGAAEFTGSAATAKAGGAVGIVTALVAFYCGLAQLLIRDEAWFTLPLGTIPKRLD